MPVPFHPVLSYPQPIANLNYPTASSLPAELHNLKVLSPSACLAELPLQCTLGSRWGVSDSGVNEAAWKRHTERRLRSWCHHCIPPLYSPAVKGGAPIKWLFRAFKTTNQTCQNLLKELFKISLFIYFFKCVKRFIKDPQGMEKPLSGSPSPWLGN